jgi:hypothetical protein
VPAMVRAQAQVRVQEQGLELELGQEPVQVQV